MDFRDISEVGIYPNAESPCGAQLNAALHSGHTAWYVPAGHYRIETTLKLPSGTRLRLDPQAVLQLADGAARNPDDYLITNADPIDGNRDIHIEGGIFDGNQRGNPRRDGLMTVGYTGAMIHFQNVRHLHLSKATYRNAEAYYARFTQVYDFHIEGITFDSDLVRPNNDGIHLGGNCARGTIRRLRATQPGVTGDDMVALNADDALYRNEVRGMTSGNIEAITITDIEAHSCHSFVRLLCVYSTIRNVRIQGIRGGCSYGAINADGARGCRVKVFDEAMPPYPGEGVGLLEDIIIDDCQVHKASANAMALLDLQERVKQLRVSRFVRDLARDQSPDTPTLRLQHNHIYAGTLNGNALEPCSTLAPNPAFEAMPDTVELDLNP